MEIKTRQLLFSILIIAVPVICEALPALEQEYKLEAYHKDGDAHTLVLKLQPIAVNPPSNYRQARQDEDDDDSATEAPVPSSTPFIPAVIPSLTKIFQGIITGNLNDIFHGSTSFAPQNVSHAIDTVYNQVVGLAPPVSTPPSTRRPGPNEQPAAPAPPQPQTQPQAAKPPAPPAQAQSAPAAVQPSSAASSPSTGGGQPLNQGSLVITTTTAKTTSNEDDEDEDTDTNVLFGRFRNGRVKIH